MHPQAGEGGAGVAEGQHFAQMLISERQQGPIAQGSPKIPAHIVSRLQGRLAGAGHGTALGIVGIAHFGNVPEGENFRMVDRLEGGFHQQLIATIFGQGQPSNQLRHSIPHRPNGQLYGNIF